MPITGFPYDGFYNGDLELMIMNGTYADFRHVSVKMVEDGKMKQSELEKIDKQWEAIPLEERKKRRARVVSDSTPKPTEIKTTDGTITVMLAVPSEGNALHVEQEKAKTPRRMKLPVGALTEENNPLLTTK